MIRYLGEPYKGSDDQMNDIVAAKQREKAGIRCGGCSRWTEGYCTWHKETKDEKSWCNEFIPRK